MSVLFPTRESALNYLAAQPSFDIIVIGGGATGLGVAVDAATRGLTVAVFESHDFGSGTSSKATKLLHGGVRYLAQGHIPLVREALRERTRLLSNAPHNAHVLPFVMPSYRWWETPFYGAGLTAYDWLAGSHSLGRTQWLSNSDVRKALPGVREDGLAGGVRYLDGQFNDARLAIDLARTAQVHGALVMNYAKVQTLVKDAGKVTGVEVMDAESGKAYSVRSRCVINATGVWVDAMRQPARPLVKASQGVHLVVSQDFMPTTTSTASAMMIPKTRDGRVLFVVPWLGHLILGTTDTPQSELKREPSASKADVDFILDEAAHYLKRAPNRSDVLSIWAGLRPLVQADSSASTQSISREHTIEVAANNLTTVTGGKWTTYRSMAEDVLAHVRAAGLLPEGTPKDGITATLHLQGADSPCNVPELEAVDPGVNPEFVQFAVQHEFARTTEDILARRSRMLFLDARRAAKLAPALSQSLMQLGSPKDHSGQFAALAEQYRHCP